MTADIATILTEARGQTPIETIRAALATLKHPKGPCPNPCPHCDAKTAIEVKAVGWLSELCDRVEAAEKENTKLREALKTIRDTPVAVPGWRNPAGEWADGAKAGGHQLRNIAKAALEPPAEQGSFAIAEASNG